MRGIFSVIGLLVVLAIVAVLAKKQLAPGVARQPLDGVAPGVAAPKGTPQQQVQQVQQAVQDAMKQARPLPDEAK
jgi:tripartite-type tricarboxylate transporter receptor subunit TctC